jgi:nucleotide-binding universal stress UspA family protein
MKVIAALNGTITSESAAFYALEYAKACGFTLVLFHAKNPGDSLEDVHHSIKNIREIAAGHKIPVEEEIVSQGGVKALVKYIRANHVDTLFSANRATRRFFSPSFSERLLKAAPGCDIAVVRVVHINTTLGAESLVLPIRQTRLGVRKFTFFAAMLKAYGAAGTVLSINPTDRRTLARFTTSRTKLFFKGINRRLAHYAKLAALFGLEVRIKHLIGESERHDLLHALGGSEYDLMIIGGQRLSFFSKVLGERPIEQILRETSVNAIAFYAWDEL